MKFSLAAAATALFATALADVDPIIIKGSKFFYKTNGTQFFMRGVAYQQEINSNTSASSDVQYTDPLSDATSCKRDIPFLTKVKTNTIRVYAINPDENHDDCMNALANAGIYVIADLSEPGLSINREDPEWNVPLFERYTKVIDVMAKYTNTLGFFAGNEVSNQKNNTYASAFVKAAVRDSKAYIKSKNYRALGVGYATNDDADIRENLASYFDCGKTEEAIDFWGYNIYSWCGESSFTKSGFDVRTKEFESYNVPVFFAEYGCNTPRPRLFTEVGALYGDDMTGVWSGGIVYMYFEEENKFGLATVDGDKVTTNEDFDNLSKEIAKATPSGVKADSYSPTNTAAASCPTVNSDWGAPSDPLPPAANAVLCSCMMSSIGCQVADSVSDDDLGDLFGTVCGYEEGKYCAGVNKNTTVGPYGAYGMCSAKEQLSFALNAYYEGQKKAAKACDFKSSATVKAAASSTASSCVSLMSQAGKEGTGTVTAGAVAGTSGSSSGSKGAAAGMSVTHVRVGSLGLGLYVLGALASGFAMILL
ncbi:carbohydrate-binding module family 43 protein [Lentithecium fluviatile CBS 122367]|uniref:1,3-beta-glucanosyltransferase n=1 Tax=Lentithecium fluviatile CBS 122367 TaxID=1168545 RepID=A0A6G1J509_9PLEO|nr:carbohydrate-binding module family 43 protein [Lentithecium fluviatile CBS 122367]